ncbi:hypothetical protein FDP41_006920 [Naegleria fowleri]|uniref:Uncharacterized protein n=1 Tax=Naegleria fowleri TaxID=5763 RepID=A0A6A5BJV8_NAEFO|nr:uncharacterized protein FDP41_006920 [Naegleria fowleri]KAF0974310.1 hypothetical protein FDP41_006920 [Naegleria fowleri]
MFPLHPSMQLLPSNATVASSSITSFQQHHQPPPPQHPQQSHHLYHNLSSQPPHLVQTTVNVQPNMFSHGMMIPTSEMSQPSLNNHPMISNNTVSVNGPPQQHHSFAFTHFVPPSAVPNSSSSFPLMAPPGPQGLSFIISTTPTQQAGLINRVVIPPQQKHQLIRQATFTSSQNQDSSHLTQMDMFKQESSNLGHGSFVPYGSPSNSGHVQLDGRSTFGLEHSPLVMPIQNMSLFQSGQFSKDVPQISSVHAMHSNLSNNTSFMESEPINNAPHDKSQQNDSAVSPNINMDNSKPEDNKEKETVVSLFLIDHLKHEPTFDSRLKDFEHDFLTVENHSSLTRVFRHLQKENSILKKELQQLAELRRNLDISHHNSQLMSAFEHLEKNQDKLEETHLELTRELEGLLTTRCN